MFTSFWSRLVLERIARGGSGVRLRAALTVVVVLPLLAGGAPAAAQDVAETAADAGSYEVVGAVYGTADDGLVGATTASGHLLRADDRLVGLPACTASACPWLPPGSGPDGAAGAQTSCAEADGLCWVELTDPATGACAAAPVRDLGPFFVKDNWWAATGDRVYALPQGVPAAISAATGADLGFGPGVSDDGVDLAGRASPPALAVAAGTWGDLGFAPGEGVAPLRVRLLWQAGLFHQEACDGEGTAAPENATTTREVALRDGPSEGAESLATIPVGRRVTITGASEGGFSPTTHGGRAGWAASDALVYDGESPLVATVAYAREALNLRAGPSTGSAVLRILPAGTAVTPTGAAAGGFVPVVADGVAGWVAAEYLT